MKLNKLVMLGLAGLAFAACSNDEEVAAPQDGQLKDISVKLSNVNLQATSRNVGDQINPGTGDDPTIQLTNYMVFFTDGTTIYQAQNVSNNADENYLWEASTPKDDAITRFHFLNPAVNGVIVIGNVKDEWKDAFVSATTVATLAKTLDAANLQVVTTHDDANLVLVSRAEGNNANSWIVPIVSQGKNETEDTGDLNPLYKADVTLVPQMARIELMELQCEFLPKEGAEDLEASYAEVANEIKWQQIALNNFYTTYAIANGVLSDLVNTALTDKNIWSFFEGAEAKAAWANDVDEYTFDKPTWVNETTDHKVKVDLRAAEGVDAKHFVYNVFPGGNLPQIAVKFSLDDVPAYLLTSNWYKVENASTAIENGTAVTKLEAGKIYKVYFHFTTEDFNKPLRCVDITVTTQDWTVEYLKPGFN